MINKFKVAAITAAMVASFGAQAGPLWFDADGAGGVSAVRISNYFRFGGSLAVENTFTGPASFTFNQWATGGIDGIDTHSALFYGIPTLIAMDAVRLSLSGTGSGTLGVGGAISFDSGGSFVMTSPLFASPIGTFTVTGGGAVIDAGGLPVGATATYAKMTSAAAGYFYEDLSGVMGADITTLAASVLQTTTLLMATNLSNQTTVSGITDALAQINANPGFNPIDVTLSDFADVDPSGNVVMASLDGFGRPKNLVFAASGQDYISVPEPASLALVGLGLFAAGALRRRKVS